MRVDVSCFRALKSWQIIGLLFALVAIVRVGMVLALAPTIPFFDEWDGVVAAMAKPLRLGQFEPAFLLASQNGHPLLWTKLVSLLFLEANGLRFDNVAVCIFNQLVYALGCTIMVWSAASRLAERGPFLVAAMLVIVLPFDWENITMGWGNSYEFLSFLSVGLLVACCCARGTATAMIGIAVLAGATVFSMASGLVAAVMGAVVLMWRVRLGELATARAVVLSAILLAWAAIAFAVGRTSHVTGQDATWGPVHLAQLALLLLCWLPAWLLLRRCIAGQHNRFDLAILCVALWAFVQIVAMILERPRYFRLWMPISRYMDIIPVGMFAVLASLCRLVRGDGALPSFVPVGLARRTLVAVSVAVVLVSPLAIFWQLRWAGFHHDQAELIRAYLKSRNPQLLTDAPERSLAYPSAAALQAWLDDPDTVVVIADAVARSR